MPARRKPRGSVTRGAAPVRPPLPPGELLSVREVCALLGCSLTFYHEHVKASLRVARFGRRHYHPRADVEAFMAARRRVRDHAG